MATRTTKAADAAKKTTAKTSASAAKPAAGSSQKPVAVAGGASDAASKPDFLKKKELLDTVTKRSGVKRRDVKLVLESALAVLGETVEGGRSLNLAPMGKLKVVKTNETTNGKITVCKLRRNAPQQKA